MPKTTPKNVYGAQLLQQQQQHQAAFNDKETDVTMPQTEKRKRK